MVGAWRAGRRLRRTDACRAVAQFRFYLRLPAASKIYPYLDATIGRPRERLNNGPVSEHM
jgi:hypothetical protein